MVIACCIIPMHPPSAPEVVLEEAVIHKLADTPCEALGIDSRPRGDFQLSTEGEISRTNDHGRVLNGSYGSVAGFVMPSEKLVESSPATAWWAVLGEAILGTGFEGDECLWSERGRGIHEGVKGNVEADNPFKHKRELF